MLSVIKVWSLIIILTDGTTTSMDNINSEKECKETAQTLNLPIETYTCIEVYKEVHVIDTVARN